MKKLIFILSLTLIVMMAVPYFFNEELSPTPAASALSMASVIPLTKPRPKTDPALIAETEDAIPRISNTDFTGRDVHHTPKEIFKPAQQFSEIEMTLQSHPEKASHYLPLYSGCARDEDIFAAVRAFCLNRYFHWKDKLGYNDESDPFFPDDIRELAEKLPEM